MALTDDDILTNHPELTYEMTHDDDFGLITFDIAGLHHCDVLTPSEIRADYMSMPFKRWILRSVEPKWRKFVGDGYQVKPHSYMGLNNLELIATRPDLPKHSDILQLAVDGTTRHNAPSHHVIPAHEGMTS